MKDYKDFDKYENEIKSVENLIGMDININPDFYIHNAILKAQAALSDPDLNTAIIKFRMYAENIEILAKAADMLPQDYKKQLKEYEETEEYKNTDPQYKHFKLANYKMQLLLGQAFNSRVSTSPMKA